MVFYVVKCCLTLEEIHLLLVSVHRQVLNADIHYYNCVWVLLLFLFITIIIFSLIGSHKFTVYYFPYSSQGAAFKFQYAGH